MWEDFRPKKAIPAIVLGVVAAVVAIPVVAWISGDDTPNSQSNPPVNGDQGSPAPASPSPGESPAPYVAEAVLLTDLQPVTKSSDLSLDEPLTLGGESHLHSIQYSCYLFCNDSPGSIEYDLGKQYSTFTATIGVNDRAASTEQVGQFIAYLDGVQIGIWTVQFGQPQAINLSVADGLRLRLDWGIEGVVSPIQAGANAAGGVSTPLPDLVWGSPTLIR